MKERQQSDFSFVWFLSQALEFYGSWLRTGRLTAGGPKKPPQQTEAILTIPF
jgi:hypothetical protein